MATIVTEPSIQAEPLAKTAELPVLPIREGVLFPKSVLPLGKIRFNLARAGTVRSSTGAVEAGDPLLGISWS